jgi:hypothetical protein
MRGMSSASAPVGATARQPSARDHERRLVRKGGFEPPRSCERQPLKLVRLPVPPLSRGGWAPVSGPDRTHIVTCWTHGFPLGHTASRSGNLTGILALSGPVGRRVRISAGRDSTTSQARTIRPARRFSAPRCGSASVFSSQPRRAAWRSPPRGRCRGDATTTCFHC